MTDSLPQQPIDPLLPANETERLAALHRYQILDTPAEAAFDRITSLAARIFKSPTALISLVAESRAWFKSSVGFDAPEVSRDATIGSFAVLTDEPLIVPDTRLDKRFACNPFVQSEPGMRFYAGAPLIDRDGFNLGTLCLLDTVPRETLTAEQQATLVDLAAMVVDELELRLAAQRLAKVDRALVEITQGVAAVTGGAFFDALVRHFAEVLGADYVYIGLVEGNAPQMMRTIATCDRGSIVENLTYRLQDTPCWEAIEQRKICCYPCNMRDLFPHAPLLKLLAVESYIAIPFYDSDGNVLGLLGVMDGQPLKDVYLAESLLTLFASRIATELERQQAELMLVEQTRLLEAIATGQTLDECLSALCSSIAKLSPSTRACVLLTDNLRSKFPRAITPDFPPSLSEGLKDVPINELAIGTWGMAVSSGQPIVCADITNDDRQSATWRELYVTHGILAGYSTPIVGSDNLAWGSLMLCFSEARQPTEWEYQLAEFGTKIANITIDRKRSLDRLKESEQRLNLALDGAQMVTWDVDLPTGQTIWSENHFRLFGYEPLPDGSTTLEMWRSCIHPDDLAAVIQEWNRAKQERSLYDVAYRIVRADSGRVVWIAATGRFLTNQAGEAVRFVGVKFDITARKQAEEDLRQAQATAQRQLREIKAIYQTAPVGLAILDPELRYERINQRLAEINGIPISDHLGRTVREIVPDLADDTEPLFRQILATGKPLLNIEIGGETLAQPGVYRTWLKNFYPLKDANGQIVGINAVVQEITDRKQAEDELRQAQALVQRQLIEIEAIYQTAPIGLTILDPELRFVRLNQRLAEINGVPIADHIGRTVREIVPGVSDENDPILRGVLATGEPLLNIEISGETQAQPGVRRTWIENCYPIKDETGRSIGINIVVQEITDRKRAEAAIQESKEQLEFLLAAAEFGDWDLNLSDGTAHRSLRHDRIFGYESLLPEWTYDMFLDHVLPEERTEVDRQYQYAIANAEPWDFECRIRRVDNQVRWIWVNGYIYHNAEGTATRMLGLVADITDRKRAEAAIAERNEELNSFAHTVSHDLKAPLRSISNLSQWIEDDLEDRLPPENQQQFQLLRSRINRMESMINSLLVYARAGRQQAPLETFPLDELLDEIIDSLAPPQSFNIAIELPLPTLTTNRLFLSQVLTNLISNAIKHHPSPAGHLDIAAIDRGNLYEFIIKDDGAGIAPEHHAKIFTIFHTLNVKDNSDSTGVGLAIVKKIVETEGGTIRLESSLDQGTTFYVTWPKSHG